MRMYLLVLVKFSKVSQTAIHLCVGFSLELSNLKMYGSIPRVNSDIIVLRNEHRFLHIITIPKRFLERFLMNIKLRLAA